MKLVNLKIMQIIGLIGWREWNIEALEILDKNP
jgi:hypothetical protein